MSYGGMHPELQRIRQEYDDLVTAVESGSVGSDEAMDLLGNIVAVDGDGSLWSFDPSTGQLVRSEPGGQPSPADPSEFAPPRLPPGGQEVGSFGEPVRVDHSSGPSRQQEQEEERPSRSRRRERSGPSRLGQVGQALRPYTRQMVVALGFVLVAGFFVFASSSDRAGDAPADAAPPDPADTTTQLPEAPTDPAPPAPLPPAPADLPPVLLDGSGVPLPLDRDTAQALMLLVSAGSRSAFVADPAVQAYALPLLGAASSGRRVEVVEWARVPDGRDRFTLTLLLEGAPVRLSWWAYVAPDSGVWRVVELVPLREG